MKNQSLRQFTFAGLTLSAVCWLAGCSGFGAALIPGRFGETQRSRPLVNLSGNNYGGHAPLAGAHIYLVEPGAGGYGSPVKSLLFPPNGNVAGTNLTLNGAWTNSAYATDQFIPAGIYGVQAAADSSYSLSGDYTCDAGSPVWVIGYGGSPTFPSTSNTFQTSTIVVNTTPIDGSTGSQYTLTTTTTENFYVGEAVLFTNFGGNFTGFNNNTVTVVATNLTTTTFAFDGPNNGQPTGIYAVTGTATASPTFNPAAVNVASLGICPSTGTLAGSISYIYMNEVSTVAWAYAYNQFWNWVANSQGGHNEFNVGAPLTTQAQQALVNAAYTAANLYDIQGGNLSTTYAGEGHIARTVTPSGAGIVPQDELNTLGNILAACVDSNNTYRLQAGLVSPQCNTLEIYATDNGAYDSTQTIQTSTSSQVAFNTAQAIANIAHYPQGNGTATTNTVGVQTLVPGTAASAAAFVTALYTLPTANVPFAPNLATDGTGRPNDFSIGINWQTSPYALSGTQPGNMLNGSTTNTGSKTNAATVGELAIDTNGNAFFNNNVSPDSQATAFVYELSPAGYYTRYFQTYYTGVGTTPISGLAIDAANDLFVSATNGVMEYAASNAYGFQANGAIGYVTGQAPVTQNSGQVAYDNNGYLYIANLAQNNPPASGSGGTYSQLVKEAATPGTTAATFTINGGGTLQNTAASCPSYMGYVTLDQANNVWTSNQNTTSFPYATICRFSNLGVLEYSYVPTPGSAVGLPHQIAIDAGNNAWIADQGSNKLIAVAPTNVSLSGLQGVAATFTAAGALNGPRGVAVDGNNTIWITNAGNASIAQFNDAGGLISPTNYVGSGFDTVQNCTTACTPSAQYAVIDQAGNLWSADIAHGEMIEWIGVAAPTVQPIADQRVGTTSGNGHGIGQRP